MRNFGEGSFWLPGVVSEVLWPSVLCGDIGGWESDVTSCGHVGQIDPKVLFEQPPHKTWNSLCPCSQQMMGKRGMPLQPPLELSWEIRPTVTPLLPMQLTLTLSQRDEGVQVVSESLQIILGQ